MYWSVSTCPETMPSPRPHPALPKSRHPCRKRIPREQDAGDIALGHLLDDHGHRRRRGAGGSVAAVTTARSLNADAQHRRTASTTASASRVQVRVEAPCENECRRPHRLPNCARRTGRGRRSRSGASQRSSSTGVERIWLRTCSAGRPRSIPMWCSMPRRATTIHHGTRTPASASPDQSGRLAADAFGVGCFGHARTHGRTPVNTPPITTRSDDSCEHSPIQRPCGSRTGPQPNCTVMATAATATRRRSSSSRPCLRATESSTRSSQRCRQPGPPARQPRRPAERLRIGRDGFPLVFGACSLRPTSPVWPRRGTPSAPAIRRSPAGACCSAPMSAIRSAPGVRRRCR